MNDTYKIDQIIAPSDNRDCPRHMCITGPLFSTKDSTSHDKNEAEDKITVGTFSRESGYDKMLICEALIEAGLFPCFNHGIFSQWFNYDDVISAVEKSSIPFNYISIYRIEKEYHVSRETISEALNQLPTIHKYTYKSSTYVDENNMHIIFKKIYDIRKEKSDERKRQHEKFRGERKKTEPAVAKKSDNPEDQRSKALNMGLYPTDEAAKYLSIPRETFRNYSMIGMITPQIFGRYKYYDKESLNNLANELKGYSMLTAGIRIGVSQRKIKRWMASGRLPYKRVGSTRRILISYDIVENLRRKALEGKLKD